MTEMKKNEPKMKKAVNTRIKRRSLLKAGAVIAPLAITLHGGIPLAHAASANCIDDMETRIKVPTFTTNDGGQTYQRNGEQLFNAETGLTGRMVGGNPETHWEYIVEEDLFGASCLQSFKNTGFTVN